MMNKKWILLVFLAAWNLSIAQLGVNASQGAKSLAMGNILSNSTGAQAIFNNQAGILLVDDISIVLDAQQRFELADLTTVSAGLVKKTGLGSFGLMISNYGNELYSDQKIGIAYARKLTDILSVGAQFNTLLLSIDQFGSSTNFSVEAGILADLTDELTLGVHIANPFTIQLTDNTDIETRMAFGLSYKPSKKVELQAEADKFLDSVINFKVGVQYQLIENLFLRSGYNTEPGTFSAGLGYRLKSQFYLDGAFSLHPQLGLSPGISIIWNKAKS